MIRKLSEREKRSLKIGAACAAAILALMIGTKWLEHWRGTKKSLNAIRAKLKSISVDEAQQAGLFSIVPVFEMPKAEEEQELLFRDKLNEQLKKVGIRSEPLQTLLGIERQGAHKLIKLKCTAKCQFTQVLDLLAELRQNPYLVGIEEIRIRVGTSTRPETGQRSTGQRPGGQILAGQSPGGQSSEGQSPAGPRQQRQEVDVNLTISTFAK
jgi:hypothetical protein